MSKIFFLVAVLAFSAIAADPHGAMNKSTGHDAVHREIDSSPRPGEFAFDVTAEAKPFFEEFVNHPQICLFTPTEISD